MKTDANGGKHIPAWMQSRGPLIPESDLVAEIKKAQAGNESSRRLVIENCKRYVLREAKKYHSYYSDMDIYQEGLIGINHAIDKFDFRPGVKFLSFASWWVKSRITRCTAAIHTIRVPYNVQRNLSKARPQENVSDMPTKSSDDLDAKEEALRVAQWVQDIKWSIDCQDLDSMGFNQEGPTCESNKIQPKIEPEPPMKDRDNSSILAAAMARLSERERLVVTMRFGFGDIGCPASLAEVAEALDLSRERVRQIEKISIAKMRRYGDFLDYQDPGVFMSTSMVTKLKSGASLEGN